MLKLPDEITPEIDEALGMMNFQTGPIAHALRADGKDIPKKCEREQAHVLFWFLKAIEAHGENWREAIGDELNAMVERRKAAAAA